jgi:plastocyanin
MSKNAITLLAIVLIAIVGATATVVYRKSNNTEPDLDDQITANQADGTTGTPSASATTSPVVNESKVAETISFTGSTFTPTRLTVKVGDTVTFVNNSGGSMWVASDPHPTHIGLRGFDAGKNFAPGENYSYTFERAGSFGFHDHLNSSADGLITVQD